MTDRTVKVRVDGDVSGFNRAMLSGVASAKAFSKELDTGTDRSTMMVQSLLAVGPAVVPIGAAAVPAISGLTNQLAFAAAGAGVTALALSGVGDALKATNNYAIEPTDANLRKMRKSLNELGTAGQSFVMYLQHIRPELQQLQNVAQAGLLPGAEAGIRDLMRLMPQAEQIVGAVATAIGDLIAEAGSNLSDQRWQEFFNFLETEARPTLIDMGRTLGNFAEGFANLWMAFDPLSDRFSAGFLQMSRDFAQWTDGLAETEGFQEFLDYIERNGPKVWDTLGSVANALLQIVEAAAPVGEASLPIIKALADVIGTIADSDLGPAIIGIVSLTSALSRLKALGLSANSSAIGGLLSKSAYAGTLASTKALPGALLAAESASERATTKAGALSATTTRLGSSMKGAAKLAGGAGGLAFVMSDLDDKMGLANTASLALAGSLFGPWGAAIGGGIGLVKDFAAAGDDATERIKSLTAHIQASGIKDLDKQRDALNLADLTVTDKDSLRASEQAYEAYQKNVKAAQDAKFAEAGLAFAMQGTSQTTRDATEALLDNIDAKNKAADAANSIFSAETNYRQALKDAEAQGKKNSAGIKGSSDAALENRESLERLAGAWNQAADAGGKTERDMAKAKDRFVELALSMGVSRYEAEKLAAELLHLPNPDLSVKIDLSKAYTQIDALKRYLKGIKDEDVRINVRRSIESGGGRGHQTEHSAAGGYITGPGTTTSDSIPAWLSNKEYVIKASSVEKYGKNMFDALNAGTFAQGGLVQRFASGGSVGGGSSSPGPNIYALPPGAQFRLVGSDLIELVDSRIGANDEFNRREAGAGRKVR